MECYLDEDEAIKDIKDNLSFVTNIKPFVINREYFSPLKYKVIIKSIVSIDESSKCIRKISFFALSNPSLKFEKNIVEVDSSKPKSYLFISAIIEMKEN